MTITEKRARYIPTGARRISSKHSAACVHVYTKDGMLHAVAFRGARAFKPAWHYRFKTEAALENKINALFEIERENQEYRDSLNKEHTLKAGDILVSSWGYDQTNIDFYQVIAKRGKTMVELRELKQDRTGNGWGGSSRCTPRPNEFKGGSFRKKADGRNTCTMECGIAYEWDGTPQYWSSDH